MKTYSYLILLGTGLLAGAVWSAYGYSTTVGLAAVGGYLLITGFGWSLSSWSDSHYEEEESDEKI